MKTITLSVLALLSGFAAIGQNEPDTTRMKLGKSEVIIITPRGEDDSELVDSLSDSSSDDFDEDDDNNDVSAHWSGLNFGPMALLNSSNKQGFSNDPHWNNDPSKSFMWEFNFAEKKFPIYKNYVGITTGLGLNWTQIGLGQRQLVVTDSNITSYVISDTISDFKKNKLRGFYITAPILLELCTKKEDGWYLAAGVIGGVRVGSLVKTVIDDNNGKQRNKEKGTYGLQTFRADATVRVGYGDWGVYANYGLTPLFDTKKTAEAHPFSVGLTLNF